MYYIFTLGHYSLVCGCVMTVSVGIVAYFSHKADNCNEVDGLAPLWRGEFELMNCLTLVRASFPSFHAVKVFFLKAQ